MTDTPKPCPFCHETEYLKYEYLELRTPGNSKYPAWVVCMNCGCHGRVVWIDDIGYDMSVKKREKLTSIAWNTRHEPEELPEWLGIILHNKLLEQTHTPVHSYSSGFYTALTWVLSLRKPEVEE